MTESTVTQEEKEAIAEAFKDPNNVDIPEGIKALIRKALNESDDDGVVNQHPDDELSDWDEDKPTLAERMWWKVYDTITFSLRSVLALVVVAVLLGAAFPGLSDVSQTAREGIIIMYKFAVGL